MPVLVVESGTPVAPVDATVVTVTHIALIVDMSAVWRDFDGSASPSSGVEASTSQGR